MRFIYIFFDNLVSYLLETPALGDTGLTKMHKLVVTTMTRYLLIYQQKNG